MTSLEEIGRAAVGWHHAVEAARKAREARSAYLLENVCTGGYEESEDPNVRRCLHEYRRGSDSLFTEARGCPECVGSIPFHKAYHKAAVAQGVARARLTRLIRKMEAGE